MLSGLAIARAVVQTVMFPADIETAQPLPPPPTTSCAGEDIRPITGYRLGTACAGSKTIVPGVCALGARAHASFGTGRMICFVTNDDAYYWAFVQYGELLAGPSTRHSLGPNQQSTELLVLEEERCSKLSALLGTGRANLVSGELSYPDCI